MAQKPKTEKIKGVTSIMETRLDRATIMASLRQLLDDCMCEAMETMAPKPRPKEHKTWFPAPCHMFASAIVDI